MKVLLLAGYETTSVSLTWALIELSKHANVQTRLREELLMKVLLLAGYETTSISLTWALIELSKYPNVQTRLREELLVFGSDPTYDQLKANLPYLDAVVHEVLRLHPPVTEFTRLVYRLPQMTLFP
ncbi:hypothetical protein AZE42_10452 [Rhizopogon vesiculosus]|uniref:Cytochrome P450 n=1 Tax=Rhizopogon vesiculosus TaxID=180088 RepID=A0A1J8PSS6_9AGAM|nr:hypothetical protein AZE42_10452 [Rhizopogon vesiculosus]